MEELLLVLLQGAAELLLQVVAELLFEFGIRAFVAPLERPVNPILAAVGYALLGAVAGGLSLWFVPALFIRSHAGQIVNAVLTPLLSGAAMAALGAWRRQRDQRLILLDRFACGYLFALTMTLVRLRFGA